MERGESTSNSPGVTTAGEIKPWWRRVLAWQYLGLCVLIVATIALHFVIIDNPNQPIFDEQHYVPDARKIIDGSGTQRLEHPPLGKLFIAAGIHVFGDNPVGWRFFPMLFGTISIILFYFICRKLKLSPRATLLATFLFSFDVLTFIQSSVAMLDVFMLTFMLAAFLLYLRGNYVSAAISVALSSLVKLYGVLAYLTIFIHWIIKNRSNPVRFLAGMITAAVSFGAIMVPLDYLSTGQWQNPIARIQYMLGTSGTLTFANAAHESATRPWQWILQPLIMPYWYGPHYIIAISFTIWAMTIPVLVYMIMRARKGDNASLFALAWFAGTFLVWVPISLVTNRISFLFYYYPTVGSICIGLGLGFNHLLEWVKTKSVHHQRATKGFLGAFIAAHIAMFLIFAPFTTWVRFY